MGWLMSDLNPALPQAQVTATISTRSRKGEPNAGIFEVAEGDGKLHVTLLGRGETVPEALRDAADRIEDGEEDGILLRDAMEEPDG